MLADWGLKPITPRTSLLHATKSPIRLAHLEIPSRHEALLSLLLPAGHLPGNIINNVHEFTETLFVF